MAQSILVINMMHIGDLLLVTPVLHALRHACPAAKITLLTDRSLRDLVARRRPQPDGVASLHPARAGKAF